MIYWIEDRMPHIHTISYELIDGKEGLDIEKINIAYEILMESYKGVINYIDMLNGLGEGLYSVEEAMAAASILLYALDGYFIRNNIVEKAKYIRINDRDIIFFMAGDKLFAGKDIDDGEFYGNNGKYYFFQNYCRKKRGSTAPTANPRKMSKLTKHIKSLPFFRI